MITASETLLVRVSLEDLPQVKAIARDGTIKHPRIVERDTKWAVVEIASEADFVVLKLRALSAHRA